MLCIVRAVYDALLVRRRRVTAKRTMSCKIVIIPGSALFRGVKELSYNQ